MTTPVHNVDDFGVELFEEDLPGEPNAEVVRLWASGNQGLPEPDEGANAGEPEIDPLQGMNGFTTFPRETLHAWLAEDGKGGKLPGESSPAVKGPFGSRRLGDALLGALLGGLVFFTLWFAGFEPPSALRPTLSRSQEMTRTISTDPQQGLKIEDAVENQKGLSELESARRDAREAARVAEEAIARLGDLDQWLSITEDKLESAECRLEFVTRQHEPSPAIERTAFAPADSPPIADPTRAYQSYAKGLGLYAAARYADAEREFIAAIASDERDARHHYFLGLARLGQGRHAAADFRRGSELERQNRPSQVFISLALESVQGEALQELSRFRPSEDRAALVP